MLPYRRLFKYRMGRYSGSYDISPKYRLIIRYSIYRSIAIPSSIDIDRSQVSRYFDISSIEPALNRTAVSVTRITVDVGHPNQFNPHRCQSPKLPQNVRFHQTTRSQNDHKTIKVEFRIRVQRPLLPRSR